MPLHDWTKATPGMFPDFHASWLTYLKNALNRDLLPPGYVAMVEQKTGLYVPDVATFSDTAYPESATTGSVALAEPATARRIASKSVPATARSIGVRHSSGNRLVAAIEVVSPQNKRGKQAVGAFAAKIADFVLAGVHSAVVDILPPDKYNPAGLHPAIWRGLDTRRAKSQALPSGQPFTFAGYRAAEELPIAYLNYTALGEPLPIIPLFLDNGIHVELPLERTYMTNFDELPARLQSALLAPSTP